MSDQLNEQFLVASEAGDLDQVKSSLSNGVDINIIGAETGALHLAAFNGHKSVVDFLLKKGADANLKDLRGFYPLHLAVSRGHVGIAKRLLKAGAQIEAKTEAGGTPLHVAAASGFPKVITALLKAGAQIEAQDTNGLTILAAAASLGQTAVVKNLLKAGAIVNTVDVGGDTPLIKAIRFLYQSRIDNWSTVGTNEGKEVMYEVKKGCFRYDDDYNASNKGKLGRILPLKEQRQCANLDWGPSMHLNYLDALDTIKVLLKEGADVTAKNNHGQTPMSLACHTGEAKVIEQLKKRGASFKNRDYRAATPLHLVAGSGRLDGLEMFLKLGKTRDINAEDDYGWTPLHYLADIGGPTEMAQLLLKRGADVEAKSTQGRGADLPVGITPLGVANRWQDVELAAVFKAKLDRKKAKK